MNFIFIIDTFVRLHFESIHSCYCIIPHKEFPESSHWKRTIQATNSRAGQLFASNLRALYQYYKRLIATALSKSTNHVDLKFQKCITTNFNRPERHHYDGLDRFENLSTCPVQLNHNHYIHTDIERSIRLVWNNTIYYIFIRSEKIPHTNVSVAIQNSSN